MDQEPVLHTAYQLAQKQFELPELKEAFDEEKAIRLLTLAVRDLLDKDLEKLLNICYRIDLSEDTLKKILHQSEPDSVASDLAKALWERQKKKAEIWKKYS
ncbi:hypothetical protein [Algoriphagus formosus]|uniref:hypothetical protein n=1 Tax=Algoriphagus formosus TaxID=2007308 RepID=UPI000C290F32|nr:hypothetical protein [Algoriphagus formosus]